MVSWKTIRVPKPAYETAKESKGENESWGDYVRRCADEPVVVMSETEVRRIAQEEITENVVENARLR